MQTKAFPRLSKWPFFLGDALLLGAAGYIAMSVAPFGLWQGVVVGLCVAGAAVLGVAPYVLEYQALVRLAEGEGLTTVVAQVAQIEAVAEHIRGATAQWQGVQEQSGSTVAAAREIAEQMAKEARAFSEFMQRANDSEKATLRLEVDKLRRAEGDWVQTLVHMLDHVYALYLAALRSRQPNVIEQMSHFQNACRDVARRVGLSPFIAGEDEAFDAKRHQLLENEGPAAAGAVVDQTLATGFTFQGRLIRPALVRVRSDGAEPVRPEVSHSAEGTPDQPQPASGEPTSEEQATQSQAPDLSSESTAPTI